MPRNLRPTLSVLRLPRLCFLLALLALSAVLPSLAQDARPTVIPAAPPHEQPITDRDVPALANPLHLSDFEGMKPSDAVKDHLAFITAFTQNQPRDGEPATEKTEVYLGYTSNALYVAFLCFDQHPELLRSHLARRENLLTDDNVGLLLDPFQDHRRGVLFQLNAAGVQADAAWTDNNDPDYSYDQVWDSETHITHQGWMGLFIIPFRSIRFHPSAPGWGVVLLRNLPRNSETDTWPHIATSISGTLTQEGTLHGIAGVTEGHNFQINPYALAQTVHQLNGLDPQNPFFSNRRFEGTGGGDVKAIVKDSIVIDGTFNPDFSQVESDQPQFTVNQRYPVYFPELRPFFLENANYFSTPIDLVYTRDIVHPEYGARVTGKLGHTNIGVLTIDDRAPGEALSRSDPHYGEHALFAIGRATQDIGKGSSIGLIYTDYEFDGSFNRIGGLDFTARFNDKWNAFGQMVQSATRHLDGSYGAGPGSWFEFNRSGHAFNMDNTFKDYATHFETDAGFLYTNNIRVDNTHANYQWYPKHSRLQSFGLELNNQLAFDHQGNRLYHHTSFDPFFLLGRKTVIAPLVGQNSDTLGPQNGYNTPVNLNFTQNFVGLVSRSAPLRQINWNIVFTHGGNPNFNPVAGAPPSLLNEEYLQALVSVLPFHSLTVDNTYLLDRNHRASTGEDVFENQTLRTKINYQFTRAFSARVIVEYDSLLVNPAQTSLIRTKQVATQALLTWLPHPGTAIYFGYNNDLQNLDRSLCQHTPLGSCDANQPILPRAPGYLNDGRQFFLKASYLLRF